MSPFLALICTLILAFNSFPQANQIKTPSPDPQSENFFRPLMLEYAMDSAQEIEEVRNSEIYRHAKIFDSVPGSVVASDLRGVSQSPDITRTEQSLTSPVGPDLTAAQLAILGADLANLTKLLVSLDARVVRPLHFTEVSADDHFVAPFSVRVSNGGPNAFANCGSEPAVEVTSQLLYALWRDALQAQLDLFEFDGDIDKFVSIMYGLRPSSVSVHDVSARTVRYKKQFDDLIPEMGTLMRVRVMVRAASVEYIKSLLFVLGHEASHLWFDHCNGNSEAEISADIYGLVLSTSILGEQFEPAFNEAQGSLMIKQSEQTWDKNHPGGCLSEAEVESRINKLWDQIPGKVLRIGTPEYERFSDKQDQIRVRACADRESFIGMTREAVEGIKADSAKDSQSYLFGRRGYRLLASVYEHAGLSESSDPTHLAFSARSKLLSQAFEHESSEAKANLLKVFGGEQNLATTIQLEGQGAFGTVFCEVLKSSGLNVNCKTDKKANTK
ncbi:MAG TPA: hypothetical protein VK788_09075 [Terriglobales bacterium]|jgi:hypothetical protein|nr:hypothetical protein [Terriglobales bacterium]